LISSAGLVEAFGHVSARLPDGDFAITSTAPLGRATAEAVLVCDPAGESRGSREALPLETPLHAAVYEQRDDVGAVARIHPPATVAAGAKAVVPGVAHGLGGLSGVVALSDDPHLVTDLGRGDAAAAALGDADCLLMRGNGAVVTAPGLPGVAVRAWFLEERARVWLAAGSELSVAERGERARHHPAEVERAWRWLQWRFGENA